MLRWIRVWSLSSPVEFTFLITWGFSAVWAWCLYLTSSSCPLIWETLVKWNCMVSELCIFTFFSWFLNVIFSVDILSFVQAGHCIEHILGSLQGWYMSDSMEAEIILLALTKSFLCFVFNSLWICSFFFDIVHQVMLLQVWEALYSSMVIGSGLLQY